VHKRTSELSASAYAVRASLSSFLMFGKSLLMIQDIPSGASVPRAVAADRVGFATCPLCHTPDLVVTSAAVSGGADWICSRCSHPWDRIRLANAAAYAASLSLRAGSAAVTPRGLL
jgi:hypothetical protein